MMRAGQPGPEGSILKLLWSETDMRMKETAIELEGPYAVLERASRGASTAGAGQYEYLWSRAATHLRRHLGGAAQHHRPARAGLPRG